MRFTAGAGQWTNWEAWPAANETCLYDSSAGIPCDQGRISLYSVTVKTVEHIITAVRFASGKNIRLVIKNTGHDFAGRSLAPRSLQIFTHNMKNISYTDEFQPAGSRNDSGHAGPTVTIQAGVQLWELYGFCADRNISLVAGFSSTVGAAGGYIQGGGHSILGPWKGMAPDHALEFTVVAANVSLLR